MLNLRVPGDLRDRIDEAAGVAGLSRSDWARRALLAALEAGGLPEDLPAALTRDETLRVLSAQARGGSVLAARALLAALDDDEAAARDAPADDDPFAALDEHGPVSLAERRPARREGDPR